MKKAMKFGVAVLATLLSAQSAFAGKVIDKDFNQLQTVEVTVNADQSFTFESCFRTAPESLATTNCHRLGSQEKYTLAELKSQRTRASLRGLGIGALDAGIVAGSIFVGFFGGAYVAGLILVKSELDLVIMVGGLSGSAVGGASGYAITKFAKKLDPRQQYKKGEALQQLMANSAGSIVVDNISAYTEMLESALR